MRPLHKTGPVRIRIQIHRSSGHWGLAHLTSDAGCFKVLTHWRQVTEGGGAVGECMLLWCIAGGTPAAQAAAAQGHAHRRRRGSQEPHLQTEPTHCKDAWVIKPGKCGCKRTHGGLLPAAHFHGAVPCLAPCSKCVRAYMPGASFWSDIMVSVCFGRDLCFCAASRVLGQ